MRVTIYQPQYFPRLHYFNRILNSDVFVILDTAQYVKNIVQEEKGSAVRVKSYQSDTPIKLATGSYCLTIPLLSRQSYQSIKSTEISYKELWTKKHLFTLKNSYAKAEAFRRLYPDIVLLLNQAYSSLAQLNSTTILWGIAALFNFSTRPDKITLEEINKKLQKVPVRLKKVIPVSTLNVKRPEGTQKGTEWTAKICQKLQATEYYHGGVAQAAYMESKYYKKLGITTTVQNWKCGTYKQQFIDKVGFIPNLSILDLLFNEEPYKAQQIIDPAFTTYLHAKII